jgi:hypothetical protein
MYRERMTGQFGLPFQFRVKNESYFQKMIKRAAIYIEKTGHGFIPTKGEDQELANWSKNKRSDKGSGKLKVERLEALQNIGFLWVKSPLLYQKITIPEQTKQHSRTPSPILLDEKVTTQEQEHSRTLSPILLDKEVTTKEQPQQHSRTPSPILLDEEVTIQEQPQQHSRTPSPILLDEEVTIQEQPQQHSLTPSPILLEYDVVLGSCLYYKNGGNINYHNMIWDHHEGYEKASKQEKTVIAMNIVHQIRNKGGRFLKPVDGTHSWMMIPNKDLPNDMMLYSQYYNYYKVFDMFQRNHYVWKKC